jgi:CBS domain-containing protein
MTELSVSDDRVGTMNDAARELPEAFAYTDETLRDAAEEMATTGVASMPVVDRETGRVRGRISATELLVGRKRAVERESKRNR